MLEELEPVSLSPALVVDDEEAMQRRLGAVLESVGCPATHIVRAHSVTQARDRIADRRFGVVLVDIGLPDGSGTELIGWMRTHRPQVPAVVVSAWRTEEVIVGALRAGAIGYLLKERDDLELALALRSIERGGAPIDPFIARRILALLPPAATGAAPAATPTAPAESTPPPSLSGREKEILRLVAQGLSNREMAEMLSISRLTVECHTKNIYRKLVVGSRTEAVFQARRHGLLS
ncbi:MAG: response regulator transcription factor [Pseudomonadota bacterium]|nr:response regulator transcription factor [Pseudomonadota bacterium]MDQ8001900.1 response regulator transcription factor [Pseudomonadota bacterium]MDQ8019565.1 response regulator transcription factor [Pseudomonadota bacterium]